MNFSDNAKPIKIITTHDGSHSLFNSQLNETYHSVHGAIQESKHVFIKNGLNFLVERSWAPQISILEMGFGTGLNALLTLQQSFDLNSKIQYTTIEAFALQRNIWSNLNYGELIDVKHYFEMLHNSPWHEWVTISNNFSLLKCNARLEDVSLQQTYDLIYFDAFAPSKQHELWQMPILKKVTDCLNPNGVFVTYCAKGQLKRDLKELGLVVETLPGPPGKKEMVRATR